MPERRQPAFLQNVLIHIVVLFYNPTGTLVSSSRRIGLIMENRTTIFAKGKFAFIKTSHVLSLSYKVRSIP